MGESTFYREKLRERTFIRIRYFGTILGLQEEILIGGSGETKFFSHKLRLKKRFKIPLSEIGEFKEQILSLPPNMEEFGEVYPNCAMYDVVLMEDNVVTRRVKIILTPNDKVLMEQKLLRLITLMNEWLAQGRESSPFSSARP
ncbi:MAG: hypothetical protein QXX99_06565 [Candidatus Bathyarchaeia archaeon]